MLYRILCFIAVSVLVPSLVAAAPLSSSSHAGFTGVGPIIFGTTPDQAAATGAKLVASKPALGSTCFYLRPSAPLGVSFLVENGTIRRAEIVTAGIRTTDGFQVGDSASSLKAFFGHRALVAPSKYDPELKTVTVAPARDADPKYRMIFQIKNDRVQAIIVGVRPQVEYVEGCS